MNSTFYTNGSRLTLCLLIAFSLLFGGCAQPPGNAGLQQKIDQLLQIQQQQAAELAMLKQQLAGQQDPPAMANSELPSPAEDLPASEVSVPEPLQLPQVAAADIAEMSRAAGLYLESFAAIATGRMADAEAGFRNFIDQYPGHEYASNAKYWLAEALFALQKPRYAETLLLEIIDNQQQQQKAPAAMARLIRYYRESGAADNANAMLQMLSSRFPESPELNRLQQGNNPR